MSAATDKIIGRRCEVTSERDTHQSRVGGRHEAGRMLAASRFRLQDTDSQTTKVQCKQSDGHIQEKE